MLVTIGDLVEDVVVRLEAEIARATDTAATTTRRQGGSAATVATVAARLGAPARLVAQVGDDAIGRTLVDAVRAAGVDVDAVRFEGTTGTIVVLVHLDGERSMLTDRRSAVALDRPDPAWLAGAEVLHVPCYSLADGPLAESSLASISRAHEQGVPVSIDLSSTALIRRFGPAEVQRLVARVAPAVVLANQAEADLCDIAGPLGGALTVIKRGPAPVVVLDGDRRTEVAAAELGAVEDTTGAGDAFAAGFLTARNDDGRLAFPVDPVTATAAGVRSAAAHLRRDRVDLSGPGQ